jgi:hypothetical protein
MQTVPQIIPGDISPYYGGRYKLKVNAIPVTFNFVSQDLQAITFPTMNTITGLMFQFLCSPDDITFNDAVTRILQVNTKIIIDEQVALYDYTACVVNLNSTRIVKR